MTEHNNILAGQIIHATAQAVARGSTSLENVPKLLQNILENDLWREFTAEETKQSVTYQENEFEKFVTTQLPNGLETTIRTLQNLCQDNIVALDLIDQAIQKNVGRPAKPHQEPETPQKKRRGRPPKIKTLPVEAPLEPTVIKPEEKKEEETGNIVTNKSGIFRPDGNTQQKGLRALRDKRPDLHKEVLEKKKTVNAAMKEAGLRRPTATIYTDCPEDTAKTLRKYYDNDSLKQLIKELQSLIHETHNQTPA